MGLHFSLIRVFPVANPLFMGCPPPPKVVKCGMVSKSLFAIALTVPLVAQQVCAQITWKFVEAGSVPLPVAVPGKVVCSGYDAAVCASTDAFYRFKSQTLLKMTLVGTITESWGTRITVSTGAKAEKLEIEPRIVLGIIRAHAFTKRDSMTTEMYNSIGGRVRNKPCLDSYDREYYCGNLTAWSDYQQKEIARKEYGIKIVYVF